MPVTPPEPKLDSVSAFGGYAPIKMKTSTASSRLKHSKAIRIADECTREKSGWQHAINLNIGNVLIASDGRYERNLLQEVESDLNVLGWQDGVGM